MVKDTKHLRNRVFLRGKMEKTVVKYLSKDSTKRKAKKKNMWGRSSSCCI